MIPALKSEFRKLLTVRSTYFLTAIVFAFVFFIGGYITGYKALPTALSSPNYLVEQAYGAITFLSIIIAITCVLIFGHEYRYNTIIYTLTLNKSRSKVLAAKVIVASTYALLMGLAVIGLTMLSTIVGAHLHDYTLGAQTIHWADVLWRALFCVWGFSMLALLIVALLRNQIASIVVLLLMPTTIEGILSLLLKDNSKYLPFTALLNTASTVPFGNARPWYFATIALGYIVGGWLIAWLLFTRRDAN